MIPPAPWAVLDLELTEPALPLLAGDEAAVWAVVRYRGAFAGILRVLPSELPMTCEEVARAAAEIAAPALRGWLRHGIGFRPAPTTARARPSGPAADELRVGSLIDLDRVLAEHRSRPATVSASIVICTRHRPQALAECLGSIVAEIDAGREVVVIDNGPEPETEAVVRAFAGVTYVAEPRPSLSRARNTGIAAASGDVVAFVDDDVRPEPGWLDPLVRGFEDDGVAVVCGLVLPMELATDAQVAFQTQLGFGGMKAAPLKFDAAFAGGFPRGVPIWNIGAGANMAVRRSAAEALGGFDERIGPGAAGGCGDDSEFWHRALFAGYTARYEPLSVVRHLHRRDWASLERQAHGYGQGHVVALFAQYASDRDRGDLIRALGVLPIHYLYRMLTAPRKRRAGRPDLLLSPLIAGYLAGLRRIGLAFAPPWRGSGSEPPIARFEPGRVTPSETPSPHATECAASIPSPRAAVVQGQGSD